MNDIQDTRYENFQTLLEEVARTTGQHYGNLKYMAEKLSLSIQRISAIHTRARIIGERSARKFEKAFNKPAGWMDRDPFSNTQMPEKPATKLSLNTEPLINRVAKRLYEIANSDEPASPQELCNLAHALENSNSHLYEDIYDQCAELVQPLEQAGFLPPSVVEALTQLTEDLKKRKKIKC